MKELQTRELVGLLPLGLSAFMLVILLCALSQTAEAEPSVSSGAMSWKREPIGVLNNQIDVSVCQVKNLVPNHSFEQGNGEPTHWHEAGPCTFVYDDPGPDSDISAEIFATSRSTDCLLLTYIEETLVEPGRSYNFTAAMKADLSQGNAYLRITFWSGLPDNWNYEGSTQTTPVTDTDDAWYKVTGVTGYVTVPDDAEYARFEAVLPKSSDGSVWFDDIFFGLATCLDCNKSDDPDPVAPGQILTYTIVCSNTGAEKATNVQVIETYNDNVNFLDAQPGPNLSNNFWETPQLLPGDSYSITVWVEVEDDAHDLLTNTVEINSDEITESIPITITTIVAVPVTSVDIHGPTTGTTDTNYIFTATVSPITTTPPITYVWQATGQTGNVVSTTDALSHTVTFTWNTLSTHIIAVTATNGGGTVTDTHEINIVVPVERVSITGTTSGNVNIPYTFTATVDSATAIVPITYVWEKTEQNGVVVVTHTNGGLSDTVSFTWNITGTQTITVTATNAEGTATDTHEINIERFKIYLPIIMRCYSPIAVPTLNAIISPDSSPNYLVSWETVEGASEYILQEATNIAFSDPITIYIDPPTSSHTVNSRCMKRYYYRVQACNNCMCSDWSNSQSVEVRWECEPNDSFSEADGPLTSTLDYYGYPDDQDDRFKINLSTNGQVHVILNNHSGSGVQLLLYSQSEEFVSGCRDWERPYEITCNVPVGTYYIRIYTASGHNSNTPYTLQATFP